MEAWIANATADLVNFSPSPLLDNNIRWAKFSAIIERHAPKGHAELLRELENLVRLLEPLERDGGLNVPGLATLNGARAAIKLAKG